MQSYCESSNIFYRTEEFRSNHCMRIVQYHPCSHFYDGCSFWVRFFLVIIFIISFIHLCNNNINRQEKMGVKTKAGQAKVWGTIICVGGAILVSFYHGSVVNIGQSAIHWKYADKWDAVAAASPAGHNSILGPILLIISAISWAIWLIIQVS